LHNNDLARGGTGHGKIIESGLVSDAVQHDDVCIRLLSFQYLIIMNKFNKPDARQSRRYTLSLSVSVLESSAAHKNPELLRGKVISFSAGGCALRTTIRLKDGEPFNLEIPLVVNGKPQTLNIPAMVIWGRDDFRVDTNYTYGMRFIEPLSDEHVLTVLKEDTLSAATPGQHPSYSHNKSVA
jgi:pimeloyl-ACP methyl ester carboxylesterase